MKLKVWFFRHFYMSSAQRRAAELMEKMPEREAAHNSFEGLAELAEKTRMAHIGKVSDDVLKALDLIAMASRIKAEKEKVEHAGS